MTNVILNWAGHIPTNTPAFLEYALTVFLAQASVLNTAWNLGLPEPIPTNAVTAFSAFPTTNGVVGSIVLNDRYAIGIFDGRVDSFTDRRFDESAFTYRNYSESRFQSWLKMTNLLTESSALELAHQALRRIGMSEDQIRASGPHAAFQRKYEDLDGTVLPLPHFMVDWGRGKGYMEISGVTSNVAVFAFISTNLLRVPTPTNYYQMLGLDPSNTIFVPYTQRPRNIPL